MYVPEDMKHLELCFVSIQCNGSSLKYVPNSMKTYDMCLIAVKNNGTMLKYVPHDYHSNEMIQAAILQNPHALHYIKNIKNTNVREMPKNAYNTLDLCYDDDSAIVHGELMVDFHKEFEYGRYYRKTTFDALIMPSKINPITRELIKDYTIYQAGVSV
jgi:hypothetical protein